MLFLASQVFLGFLREVALIIYPSQRTYPRVKELSILYHKLVGGSNFLATPSPQSEKPQLALFIFLIRINATGYRSFLVDEAVDDRPLPYLLPFPVHHSDSAVLDGVCDFLCGGELLYFASERNAFAVSEHHYHPIPRVYDVVIVHLSSFQAGTLSRCR